MGRQPPPPEERAAQLITELRDIVREGHGLLKDLRALNTTAQRLIDVQRRFVESEIDQLVNERLKSEVGASLESYHGALGTMVIDAEQRIARRFDKFIAALLGSDAQGHTLEEIIEAFMSRQQLLEARLMEAGVLQGTPPLAKLRDQVNGQDQVNVDLSKMQPPPPRVIIRGDKRSRHRRGRDER